MYLWALWNAIGPSTRHNNARKYFFTDIKGIGLFLPSLGGNLFSSCRKSLRQYRWYTSLVIPHSQREICSGFAGRQPQISVLDLHHSLTHSCVHPLSHSRRTRNDLLDEVIEPCLSPFPPPPPLHIFLIHQPIHSLHYNHIRYFPPSHPFTHTLTHRTGFYPTENNRSIKISFTSTFSPAAMECT